MNKIKKSNLLIKNKMKMRKQLAIFMVLFFCITSLAPHYVLADTDSNNSVNLGDINHYNAVVFGDLVENHSEVEGAMAIKGDFKIEEEYTIGYSVGNYPNVVGESIIDLNKPLLLLGGNITSEKNPTLITTRDNKPVNVFSVVSNDFKEIGANGRRKLNPYDESNVLVKKVDKALINSKFDSMLSEVNQVSNKAKLFTSEKPIATTALGIGEDKVNKSVLVNTQGRDDINLTFNDNQGTRIPYVGDKEFLVIYSNAENVDFKSGLYYQTTKDGAYEQVKYSSYTDPQSKKFHELARKLLWVFPNAKTVNVAAEMGGSIFAPKANVVAKGGTINGQVFVNNITQYNGAEVHNFKLAWSEWEQLQPSKPTQSKGAIKLIKKADDNNTLLQNAVFQLKDSKGTVIKNTASVDGNYITDSKGEINVLDLPLGVYTFEEITPPNGYKKRANSVATFNLITDKQQVTEIVINDKITYASLGDKVWHDKNRNGIQDSGEEGISNVLVTLLKGDGTATGKTTTTDVNGSYIFEGLDAGDYKVQFEMPSDYKTWTEKGKGDGKNDSKVNFIKNTDNKVITDVVTLKAGDKNLNQDAGVTKLGSIGDLLWNDANQNGKQDPGEEGLPGQKVALSDDKGNEIATTTTDSNGKYKFENLVEGNYVVTFTKPEGYKFTAKEKEGVEAALDSNTDESGKATVTLGYGENNTTIDAGIYKPAPEKCSLGDKVWHDKNRNGIQDSGEEGISNVLVTLLKGDGTATGKTTTTDVNGNYIFEGLDAGDYKVQFEMPSDYKTWTEKGKGDGKNDSKVNFIKNTDNKVTTDVVTLKAGDKNLNQDAGVTKLGSIGDLLWNDANQNGKQDPGEEGLPGQKVTLNDDKGNEIATTTTDSNGKYKFENLLEGNYVVTFTKPDGYKFTAKEKEGVEAALDSNIDESGKATVTLGYGENNITVDAGILKVEPSIPNKEDKVGKIGDTVWLDKNNNGVQDEDEAGVDGVKITLYSEDGTKIAETMTKNGGKYLFDNLKYGDYKIVFELPKGYKFTKQGSIDEDLDSDADNTGLTKIIKLDEKTSIKLTIDAGVVKCDDKLVSTSENEKILKNKNEKIINAIVKTGEVLGTNQLLLLGMISGVLGVIVIKRKR